MWSSYQMCVCRYVCVGCGSVCVSSKGDVAWRSLLSDPMSRPMLWCEGHCQETTTRQHRYSCPQCSFSSVAHTHTHWWELAAKNIHAHCKVTHSGGKSGVEAPGLCTRFKTNAIAYLLAVCLLGTNYVRFPLSEKVVAIDDSVAQLVKLRFYSSVVNFARAKADKVNNNLWVENWIQAEF